MKKMILFLVLILATYIPLFAPVTGILDIPISSPILRTGTPQEWLKAIVWVETRDKGSKVCNRHEPQAQGKLQQWPIFVDDVNRILKHKKYSYKDRLNDKKAEEMFWIYQKYYNPEMSFEKMCRIQCGGPSGYSCDCTLNYYTLVKTHLFS
jgi:hypothetical protein